MSATLPAGPLGEVTRSVLGDAAFLFCDDLPGDAQPLTGRLAEATISFEAACPGRITLRLPWSVALDAAANLLGTDRDDPEAEQHALGAVGELLNMISCAALQRWLGASASWALGVPSTRERVGALPSAAPEGEVVGYAIDELRIEVEAIEGGSGDDQGPGR